MCSGTTRKTNSSKLHRTQLRFIISSKAQLLNSKKFATTNSLSNSSWFFSARQMPTVRIARDGINGQQRSSGPRQEAGRGGDT